MKQLDTTRGPVIALDYDEEHDFARFVMRAISFFWVSGRFNEHLEMIYNQKTTLGLYITQPDLEYLLDFVIKFSEQLDEGGCTFPDLGHTDGAIGDEIYKTHDRTTTNYEICRAVQMAWKEAYQKERSGLIKISDTYQYFPDSQVRKPMSAKVEANSERTNVRLEREFWEEVDRVQQEYDCDRKYAVIMVSDYKPREL